MTDTTVENTQEDTVAEVEQREVETTQAEQEVIDQAKEQGVSLQEFERTKAALAKANKEAADRRHKLSEWEKLGVDPDKVQDLLEKQRKAEEARKKQEGRYEELMAELQEKTSKQVQEKEQQLLQMQEKLKTTVASKEMAEALAKEGVKSKLAKMYITPLLDVVENEFGELTTVVKDDRGEVRTKEDGKYFTVNDLLDEMKQDDEFSALFPAPKISGTGSANTSTNTPTSNKNPANIRKSDLKTIADKVAFQEKYGMDAYKALK